MSYAEFVAAANACRTESDFHRSPLFAAHGPAIAEFLRTPRAVTPAAAGPSTPPAAGAAHAPSGAPRSDLRVVHWNIEKGKQLGRLVRRLREEPRLAEADVWCFNEVDDGMARTGNLDVAQELSTALGAPGFFLPTYIECTKGLPDEHHAPGDNRLGLHGLAILTRRPVRETAVLELPSAWDYFDYPEKRVGGRRVLVVRIDAGFGDVDILATHLEMRSPPEGRTRQIASLLSRYADRTRARGVVPALLAGDLNTHTFSRGRSGDTLRGFLRVIGTEPDRLSHGLLHPESREGLFARLAAAGWERRGFNDVAPTAWQSLRAVEDLRLLPPPLGRLVLTLFRLKGRRLPLRLDWFFGTGLMPLDAATLDSVAAGAGPASDHEPIWTRAGPS